MKVVQVEWVRIARTCLHPIATSIQTVPINPRPHDHHEQNRARATRFRVPSRRRAIQLQVAPTLRAATIHRVESKIPAILSQAFNHAPNHARNRDQNHVPSRVANRAPNRAHSLNLNRAHSLNLNHARSLNRHRELNHVPTRSLGRSHPSRVTPVDRDEATILRAVKDAITIDRGQLVIPVSP